MTIDAMDLQGCHDLDASEKLQGTIPIVAT